MPKRIFVAHVAIRVSIKADTFGDAWNLAEQEARDLKVVVAAGAPSGFSYDTHLISVCEQVTIKAFGG